MNSTPSPHPFAFTKAERLCSEKHIETLFKEGKSFFVYPFKVVWMEVELSAPTPAQILISAPKRRFKLAVHRNRIKRLVREAYRQNKQPLYHHLQTHQKQLVFMLFYAAKNIMPYKEIEGKIIILLQRLIKEHEKTSG